MAPKLQVVAGIGHLKSYKHMGMANVSCSGGCQCDPTMLDGHWGAPSSQENWAYFGVTQAAECLVTVTSTDETNSDGHKVKITSLLLSCMNANNEAARALLPRRTGTQVGGWNKGEVGSDIHMKRLTKPAADDEAET